MCPPARAVAAWLVVANIGPTLAIHCLPGGDDLPLRPPLPRHSRPSFLTYPRSGLFGTYPRSGLFDARRLWLAGRPALFPVGTYWLARHAFVPVAEPPKISTAAH